MLLDSLKSTLLIFIFTGLHLTILSSQTNKTFFLGHSLTNFDIPNMVNQLSIASGQTFSYDANIGIGASLNWHWVSPSSGQGSQWNLTLPQGGYENFIITEAVPLENHLQYSNTYRIVDSLYSFANEYNPNIQYYIYETWHCINSGNGSTSGEGGYPCSYDPNSNTPWRDRINMDLPKWESIADSMDLFYERPMLVIPGGQALGNLDDTLRSGIFPGMSSVYDLFNDEYHLDARGNYFIACVMYSVLHGESPLGLPNQLMGQYGNLYEIYPSASLAAVMQEVAWKTVCDYPRSGITCETVGLSEMDNNQQSIHVYPNPTKDFFFIENNDFSTISRFIIYDYLGRSIQEGVLDSKSTKINISHLPTGLYFLQLNNKTIKIIK